MVHIDSDVSIRHGSNEIENKDASGTVQGSPLWILRGEGAAVLLGAVLLYASAGFGWWQFAILFLVPDLSMLGYLSNKCDGAITYNLGHNYLLPAVLLLIGEVVSSEQMLACSLIWIAHVGFDRMLGYGLKYQSAFKHTHLSTSS